MIIDLHVHPFCKDISIVPNIEEGCNKMLSQNAVKAAVETIKNFSIENILQDMDESKVDVACIVAMDCSFELGIELVTNEDVSKLAKLYPDRFIPFASVDPSWGQNAIDRLVYAVKELGCKGLKLVPPVQKFDFSDPKHFRLWETALELDIIVWTHAAHQVSTPGSDARLGHPMLVEPVALKYPDLKIVLGHCGFPWVWEVWSLVNRHQNVYMDISAYPSLYNHMPWDAYSKYGIEHKVLFATDYPLYSFKETIKALDAVDISEEYKKSILGENAKKLLKL